MERRNFLRLLGVATAAAVHAACAVTVGATDEDASDGGASPDGSAPRPDVNLTGTYVIRESFTVLLNDSSCSGHSHTVYVRAGSFDEDTPVHYLGGSHDVAFLPSELVRLQGGERLPFSTIGMGPGHGHCGTAWRTSVGPEERNRPDACVLRSATARCDARR